MVRETKKGLLSALEKICKIGKGYPTNESELQISQEGLLCIVAAHNPDEMVQFPLWIVLNMNTGKITCRKDKPNNPMAMTNIMYSRSNAMYKCLVTEYNSDNFVIKKALVK